MQIENEEFKNIAENFSKAIFKEKHKTASFDKDEGVLKFNFGNDNTKNVKVEQVLEFYDSFYDNSKKEFKSGNGVTDQHEAIKNKFFLKENEELSLQDKKNNFNLERLRRMKIQARQEAFKLSGKVGREIPKGEYQVYSPTKKRNVIEGLASEECAAKWLKKYQSVEPREQLAVLKNNIPVKKQPGIKEAVKLQRNNPTSRSIGVKH